MWLYDVRTMSSKPIVIRFLVADTWYIWLCASSSFIGLINSLVLFASAMLCMTSQINTSIFLANFSYFLSALAGTEFASTNANQVSDYVWINHLKNRWYGKPNWWIGAEHQWFENWNGPRRFFITFGRTEVKGWHKICWWFCLRRCIQVVYVVFVTTVYL